MLSENFLTSESINELGNFYGVASVDMSPDEIWNTGSVWLVWRQTCQTDGVLLMSETPVLGEKDRWTAMEKARNKEKGRIYTIKIE